MRNPIDEFVLNFTLSAPSRLHFGLYSVAGLQRFGGIGLMVNQPQLNLTCVESKNFEVVGQQQELLQKVIGLVREKGILAADPFELPIRIELVDSPPRHNGMGSGTQIAFAVATALLHCLKMPALSASQMAELVDRGKRSAIGSYGFFSGGCIADSGLSGNSTFSPIESRIDFPANWPIVLIRPEQKSGLHGQYEQSAFNQLRNEESENRERLKQLAGQEIVPGIEAGDYKRFANALYDFNRSSGEYFSEFQSGAYNSPRCAEIVKFVRSHGCPAVGQSSWGPTLFAVASSKELADDLVKDLRNNCPAIGAEKTTEIIVTNANNSGMQIADHLVESQ